MLFLSLANPVLHGTYRHPSSNELDPYAAQSMAGLIEPININAMKREKGETIQTDLRAMDHLDTMMKNGMNCGYMASTPPLLAATKRLLKSRTLLLFQLLEQVSWSRSRDGR